MTNKTEAPERKPLWTRDFTIITLGSVVSMLGSTLSSFAMNLMVLDATGSTPLFALYSILYMLPTTLAPILIGPFLDRFSRKKTIYTLDFITAGLFAILTAVLMTGHFSFYLLAAANFSLGAISGIYFVAYDSFYPLLISEGNFSRAYSVSATLETLTMFMVPLSTFIYKTFGILPLFIANTVTYLVAAVMETQIRAEEAYIGVRAEEPQQNVGLKRFTADFREGMRYLISEKGLLAIAVYFGFSSLNGGMTEVVTLPWFRGQFADGEYVFALTWGMASLARFIGGLVHYNIRLPEKAKYAIALTVYISIAVLEGTYLFTPVPVMMIMTFLTGILGVTSYNIRISATQKYVPDEKKGRFNGVFITLNTGGALLGQAAAGALSSVMDERLIVVLANVLCLAAALSFIGCGKKEVSRIYNTSA